MQLKNFSSVLFVRDIAVSKHFYHDLLGFPVDLDFGTNIIYKNGLATWQINEQHIIPKTLGKDKITDPAVNRFELYFETEDLTTVNDLLKKNKVRFLHEIHEEPWGQQTMRFFDPDNHLIEIGETLKEFVCRFYNQGMTVEQVSRRTSVPVEEVRKIVNDH